jgi:type II secretory pathway component PulK
VAKPRGREGYALLAVLWIAVAITALVGLLASAARLAVASSRNRIAMTVAGWQAAACATYARAAISTALRDDNQARFAAGKSGRGETWSHVDRILSVPRFQRPDCTLSARVVGSRLDVNEADQETLTRLLRAMGVPAERADSVARAIALAKPFTSLRDLHDVPETALVPALDSVLDVEPGPLSLNHAPAPLLALLPGFTSSTVEHVLDERAAGAPIASFYALGPFLSPDEPAASARLPGIIVLEPTAWIVRARSSAGAPPVTALLELRIANAGWRTATTRRRSWTE